MMKKFLFKLSLLTSAILSCSLAIAQQKVETTPVLPTIEVTAEEGAKTKTNVVTIEKQNKSTETTLRGLLSDEPAIDFAGGNGRSQWITIRGMGQDQISMVVDGSSTDAQMFHHESRFGLDPSLIKIVKVQKGTGSASSGIGINNGAIIAKTVDAQDLLRDNQNFGFKINGGYASNDEHSYGASVFARAGKFDFLVGTNFQDQSHYKAGKKDGSNYEVSNSALDNRAWLAKIGFNANDNHRFVLGHRNQFNKGVRNLREEFDFIQTGGTRNSPVYREIEVNQTTLEWQGKNLGFISQVDADVSYAEQTRAQGTPLARPTGTNTWAANINLDSEVAKGSLLKYGVNYRKQEGYPSSGQIVQEKTDVGVYVESVNKVGNFTITGGLRYDAWDFETINGSSRSDYDLNPSLSVVWDINNALSVNASHSYATRSPRFVETLLTGNNNTTGQNDITISQDTVADRTRNTEIGFNFDYSGLSVDGSYFWTYTDNLASIIGRNTISNNGRLKNTGYELNTAYQWDALKLRAGVAYNKPTLNGASIDNVTVAMPIGRTWTTGVSYQFDTPNIEVGYKGRIVQDTSYVNGSGTTIKRDGYDVHDIYANWKPLNDDRLNVNFAINNIADKYYKSHSQRATDNALPSAGRDFRVGFNYTF
ncbi:TonB-dependent receptor domain-containing protein [Moraxella sp. ZY210820]|uniref:TonB-dependent receptor domain-containing protein n=1 Tax=unclassified Moraxella TaxID=2685852 RepID=UPI00273181C0|nr:TonB-dependent receptor [Moraxella sp. ZY210820]WLF83882.1 TonB-dependent receptor [Moraxella sp. ZY210820]